MLINEQALLDHVFPERRSRWDADAVILYHLGLGTGLYPGAEAATHYLYEKDLRVLPSFAVTLVFESIQDLNDLPGIDIDPSQLLHAAHELRVYRPLPVTGELVHQARVVGVYDRGTAAQLEIEVTSRDGENRVCCTNRFSLLLTDRGGFGGQRPPRSPYRRPTRPPDQSIEIPVMPGQAALYRLSGDKNPVHIEPEVAQKAGFSQPLLHGLCSFGIACRGAADLFFAGDPGRITGLQATFGGPAFPGETLLLALWQTDEILFYTVKSAQRGTPVISGGAVFTS
ncbi:MaoC/PaaZ C-terminal domain-containing protein [Acanthopleuribacter pedis]|uniref:MaoC family dehydratase N-terminal domain-containing protein n=1 Tax=Acanthopleuribacter pedis TaxID=442870 RepID=A0A8J7QL62_9BACT|nr:MaoC/PaaZ C-terminal domain-containing protein [Acanthopleuribacter pedis]MBO1323126.1 MaoC family dehydratase N-terminal domain-containing protein [Acanthopleuribacter pedis]